MTTLYVKMDDWNRLCDYFGLVHGSDIDMIFRKAEMDSDAVITARDYQYRIRELEKEIEDLEEDCDDLRYENKILKEKLEAIKRMSLDTIEEIG